MPLIANDAERAARVLVPVGAARDVLAVIEDGEGLSVLTAAGGAWRLRLAVPVPADGRAPSLAELVLEHGGGRVVLASGGLLEVAAIRDRLARGLAGRLRARSRRRAAGWAAGATAAAALLAILVLPVVPVTPPTAARPEAMVGQPHRLPEALREAIEGALAAQRQGGFTRVDEPVSLDADPAPAPRAGEPGSPRADVTETPAAAGRAAIRPEPLPTGGPTPGAAPALPAAGSPAADAAPPSSLDVAGARRLLDTLRELRAKAEGGEAVTPEMLEALPPGIAERLRGTGILEEGAAAPAAEAAVESLPARALAGTGTDSYGIPDTPPANSWAATGGNVVIPLPGGGDIRAPADIAGFGLEP